jgi:toxin-antitoxin system PIN domain toxin
MTTSTTSFLFPDINVWLALTFEGHPHHHVAIVWFDSLPDSARLYFCRFTQMGLLRLLTTDAVMKPSQPLTQQQAWHQYDRWLEDDRVIVADEQPLIEDLFRRGSQLRRAAPKDWADSYLIAFAMSSNFQLVTFDRAMTTQAKEVLLLTAG